MSQSESDFAAPPLAEAQALSRTLHLPGVRDRYRQWLARAIAQATEELGKTTSPERGATLRRILVEAHAARAEDARYGAGQLSRGAQRAPMLRDTEDGWLRVREIVQGAADSAKDAEQHAAQVNEPHLFELARRARHAAEAAAQIVADRNRAYTFQTLPGLSFGEGWYLAAAAVFFGVPIQIQPGTPQELQARRFLEQAGLTHLIVPYRPRPASPKHLTALIAQAFENDPQDSQLALRAAFLGDAPPRPDLVAWTGARLEVPPEERGKRKVMLWVRVGTHHAHRNTDFGELVRISRLARDVGFLPIYFGDAVPQGLPLAPGVDLTLCWKTALFQGADMRRTQLQLFELLRHRHGLVGQVGVTSAGMDGPALLGLPTVYLTQEPNVRLGRWVGAVPGYREVVQDEGQWDALRRSLQDWSRS